MLVYASRLQLAQNDAFDTVKAAVADWLKSKTGSSDIAGFLERPGRHELGANSFLDVSTFEATDRRAASFRFGHPDRSVSAREWHTEVGVLVAPEASYCSVLLQAHDSSAQVLARTETTRPMVVQKIVQRCRLGRSTPGGEVRLLTETDAEAFEYGVRDRTRSFPIVQVSPRREGGHMLEPSRLCDLLTGIAEVVVIPDDTDTFALSNALGSRFSAYDGAVNILWPVVDRNGCAFVPSSRLLAADIENILLQGRRPESDLLALICHETNSGLARLHISTERVQSMVLRAALDAAKLDRTSRVDDELQSLYRQVDQEQRVRIEQLEGAVQDLERRLTAEQSEGLLKDVTVSALKTQLTRASAAAPSPSALTVAERDVLLKGMDASANLEDCLRVIETLFRERIVVLESASTSARKAKGFGEPRDAFDLLVKLCTGYFDAMVAGKGDRAGVEVFGNKSFAARESETVENNKRARALRSFVYKGESIEMMRHLKLGVKDSVDKTFRAHFHWDPGAKRIVLGHCGKHLDHG